MAGSHRRSSTLWEWLVPGLIGLLPLGMAVDADITEAAALEDRARPEPRSGRSAGETVELTNA